MNPLKKLTHLRAIGLSIPFKPDRDAFAQRCGFPTFSALLAERRRLLRPSRVRRWREGQRQAGRVNIQFFASGSHASAIREYVDFLNGELK